MNTRVIAPAVILSIAAAPALHAQGVATDRLIDSITVIGDYPHGVETAGTTASKTAEELRTQNLVNPEDALKYLPNLTIRKRYIGDRNALIGGRSFSTLQAPRGLVFMDGYLLSNFLGRFDAPRWNMIAPEEIERVDVLYGPFSAIYPGNSIGATVVMTTRRPDDFESSARTTGFMERFGEYGLEDDYGGYQISGYLGDRLDKGAWYSLAANRQDSTSHPMQYYTVFANAAGAFPPLTGPATPVTGVRFDRDPQGRRRAVFGAGSGALDHTLQHQLKLRSGYALNDGLEVEGFAAVWSNDTENENRTFMRDMAGGEVWRGAVVADGVGFDVPSSALTPGSLRKERHMQWGTTLRTTRDSGWNGSVVFSGYDIREDFTLEANSSDPTDPSGTNTERDGTGWRTFEAQGVYAPLADDWTGGAHRLVVGYHRNDYRLVNPLYATDDWRTRSGQLTQEVRGETSMQALYLEDAWALTDRWALTLGVRYEDWQAMKGLQFVRFAPGSVPEVYREIYSDRSEAAASPKASLSFAPDDLWQLRLSAARGVRFPTVAELFLGAVTSTQVTRNDPNLKPEVSDALDFSVQRGWSRGSVRASIFQDDVRDTIWNQINLLVFPRSNTVQNIDRVRTRGLEAAFTVADCGIDALNIEGNVAYAESRILRNDNNPAYVGNQWPRIPSWRANLQAVWRPTPSWLASLGVRYSGRMYGRLENDDINPDTYGGVSRYTIADARVAYTGLNGVEMAIGIDNLANQLSYQHHPYPARTGFVEARWSLQDAK